MAAHPVPFDPVDAPMHQGIKLLPQFGILHRLLARRDPALLLPAVDPFGDALTHILAIEVQRHPARPLERLQAADHRHQLHAVVGGVQLAAIQLLAVRS